jgi:hypothetical protein
LAGVDNDPLYRDVEALLAAVAALVADRQDLRHKLASLGIDLQEAHDRIDELEHLVAALELATYRTKQRDKRRVGSIATAIAGLAAGVLGGISQGVGSAAWEEFRGVRDKAAIVSARCEVHVDVSVPAPPPATGEPGDDQHHERYGPYQEGYGSGAYGMLETAGSVKTVSA